MKGKRKHILKQTTYTYRFADKIEMIISAGVSGVTDEDIHLLLSEDRLQQCNDRHENEKKHMGIESLKHRAQVDPDNYDDVWKMISAPKNKEFFSALPGNVPSVEQLLKFISRLQPQQIELIYKVYYDQKTVTEIAAEEKVSRAAIYNRLKKIFERIKKMYNDIT